MFPKLLQRTPLNRAVYQPSLLPFDATFPFSVLSNIILVPYTGTGLFFVWVSRVLILLTIFFWGPTTVTPIFFMSSVEILAIVSQELYSTPVKMPLHCPVRKPLSQSPAVRKAEMSMLLWSRRRFDGLKWRRIWWKLWIRREYNFIFVSKLIICITRSSQATCMFLLICRIHLPLRPHVFTLTALTDTVQSLCLRAPAFHTLV